MKTQEQLLAHVVTSADWGRISATTRASLLRSQKRADFVGRRVRSILTSVPHKTAQTFLTALTAKSSTVGRLKSPSARKASREKNSGVGLRAYHRFPIPDNASPGVEARAKKAAETARSKALAAVRAKGRVKLDRSPWGYYALYGDWDVATRTGAVAAAAKLRAMGFSADIDTRPIGVRKRASGGPKQRYVSSGDWID